MANIYVDGLGDINIPDDMPLENVNSYVEGLAKKQGIQLKPFGTESGTAGIGEAFVGGAKRLLSSQLTGLQTPFTGGTEAAKSGIERQRGITERPAADFGEVGRKYEEEGILSAAKELASQIPSALAEQAPFLAESFAGAKAGARLGAMAGAPFEGVGAIPGAIVGGALGAFAPSFIAALGGNVERQAQEQIKKGAPVDVDTLKATGAAIPQGLLDAAEQRFVFGKAIIGKILGLSEKEIAQATEKSLEKQLRKLGEEGALGTLGRGTIKGLAVEVPTEVAQQALERWQAGLPLADKEAFQEYGETAYSTALLGPLGAVGRFSEKGQAREELARRDALEEFERSNPDVASISSTTPSNLDSTRINNEATNFLSQVDREKPFDINRIVELTGDDVAHEGDATAVANELLKRGEIVQEGGTEDAPQFRFLKEEERIVPHLDESKPYLYASPVTRPTEEKTAEGYEVSNPGINVTRKAKTPEEAENIKTQMDARVKRNTDEIDNKIKDLQSTVKAIQDNLNVSIASNISDEELGSRYDEADVQFRDAQEKIAALQEERGKIAQETSVTPIGEQTKPESGYEVRLYRPGQSAKTLVPFATREQAEQFILQNATPEQQQAIFEDQTPHRESLRETQKKMYMPGESAPEVAPETTTEAAPEAAGEAVEQTAPQPTPEMRQRVQAVTSRLRGVLDQMGLNNVGLNVSNRLTDMVAGKLTPIDGMYLNRIINVSLSAERGVLPTFGHETIHALREMGMFSDKEWDVLSRKAKSEWIEKYSTEERYKHLNPEEQIEEAVADAFGFWMSGEYKPTGVIRGLLNRIKLFLESVGSVFRGQGFDNAEKVFTRALAGELKGAREAVASEGKKFALPDTINVDGVERPTTNSDGRQIYPTEEGIRNFWRWFGDSKVVDSSGRPIVVYHGTTNELEDGYFKLEKSKGTARFGPGFYFSDEKETFNAFANQTGGQVIPAYLKIENPLVNRKLTKNQIEKFFDEIKDKVFPNGYDATNDHERIKNNALESKSADALFGGLNYFSQNDWVRGLKAAGFDGVIHKAYGGKEYVALNPNQVKSAIGNTGAFSPTDKRIKYALPNTINVNGVERPTTNSYGKPIHSSEETIRNFWNWFGNSKVVDEQGRPVVMYHGTAEKFEFFDFARTDGGPKYFFVTPVKDFASDFAETAAFYKFDEERDNPQFAIEEKKSAAINAIDRAKNDGVITEEKANYWKEKVNKNKSIPNGLYSSSISSYVYDEINKVIKNSGFVMPLYAKAENPFLFDNEEHIAKLMDYLVSSGKIKEGTKRFEDFKNKISEGDFGYIENPLIQNSIKKLGFDGFYVLEGGVGNLAVYNPNQLKSTENLGTFSAADKRVKHALPMMYSALDNAILAAPKDFDKKTGKEWAGWLKNNGGKFGVKPDEMFWTGLNDYLEVAKDSIVTRAALSDFVQKSGPQLGEIIKGGRPKSNMTREQIFEARSRVFAQYDQDIRNLEEEKNNATSYYEIQRLDDDIRNLQDEAFRIADEQYPLPTEDEYAIYQQAEVPEEAVVAGGSEGGPRWSKLQLPGGKNYVEVLLTLPVKEGEKAFYKRSHYAEPNIVLHLRMNERRDINGDNVLFVEELQSDWGQAARKQGVAISKMGLPEGFKTFQNKDGDWYVINRNNTQVSGYFKTEEQATQDAIRRFGEEGTAVPNAPFIGKTSSWVDLGLKRAITYAIENGFDKVAFINGKQNADRYDLSKDIDSIIYAVNQDGTYRLGYKPITATQDSAYQDTINNRELDGMTLDDIEETFGKEIAEKIEQGVGSENPFSPGVKKLENVDLVAGGEGMKAFYDNIVPTRLKELVRKVGGNISTTEIEVDGEVTKQVSLDLIPDVANKIVTQGVPKFALPLTFNVDGNERTTNNSKGFQIHPTITGVRNFWRWFGDGQLVDSMGRPRVFYHGSLKDIEKFKAGTADAIFFAPNPTPMNTFINFKVAQSDISQKYREGGGYGVVYPVYINAKNVFDYENPEHVDALVNEVMGGAKTSALGLIKQAVLHPYYSVKTPVEGKTEEEFFVAPESIFEPKKFSKEGLRDALSRGNWPVFETGEVINAIKKLGFDAFHINESLGGQFYKNVAVFSPNQIKSAVGNNGLFEPQDPRIQHALSMPKTKVINSINAASKPFNKRQDPLFATPFISPQAGIGVLNRAIQNTPTRSGFSQKIKDVGLNFGGKLHDFFQLSGLVDLYGDDMPIRPYYDSIRKMMGARDVYIHESTEVSEEWQRLNARSLKDGNNMATVMNRATFYRYDPSKDPGNKNQRAPRTAEEIEIQRMFDALPKPYKELYVKVRNFYRGRFEDFFKKLEDRVKASVKDPKRAQDVIDQLKKQYNYYNQIEPYFPLTRFGEYWVRYTENGQMKFEMFENAADQNSFRTKIMSNPQITDIKYGVKLSSLQGELGASDFVKSIMDSLDQAKGGFMGQAQIEDLKDSVWQLYLSNLPELSMRKQFLHRSNVPGYSNDALRAFQKNAFHGAYHMARLEFAPEAYKKLNDIRQFVSNLENTNHPDAVRLGEVFNSISSEQRQKQIWRPDDTTAPFRILGQLGFLYYLSTAASAVTNLSQNFTHTFPILGAEYGYDRATKELARSYKQFFESPSFDDFSDVTKSKSKTESFLQADKGLRSIFDITRTLEQLRNEAQTPAEKDRYTREIDAINRLYQTVISRSQAMDLAGATDRVTMSGNWFQVGMRFVAMAFHGAEVVNRTTTGLVAYRLEMEKLAKEKPGLSIDERQQMAVQRAAEIVDQAHFNYSEANRSPLFGQTGNLGKVIFMFKSYAIAETTFLFNAFRVWSRVLRARWKGTPLGQKAIDDSRKAKRMLLGVMGMQALFAGALGLPTPLMMIVMGLANMMGDDDDDEDKDLPSEVRFKKWLVETFGENAAQAIAYGPMSYLTGADFNSRVGLNTLWFRDPNPAEDELDQTKEYFLQLGGPIVGLGTNFVQGLVMMNQGQTERGLEKMVPNIIKAPLQAYRFGEEGATTAKGDVILDELTTPEKAMTFLGFTPFRLALEYKQQSDTRGAMFKANLEKKRILLRFNMAAKSGDSDGIDEIGDDIAKYNQKYPGDPITYDTLSRSLKATAAAESETVRGLRIPKKQRGIAEGVSWLEED